MTIEKGSVYGILGPNGSGKSTTLGIALNVVNKTAGEVSVVWMEPETTHRSVKESRGHYRTPKLLSIYDRSYQNLKSGLQN